jgi:hypothetical protein
MPEQFFSSWNALDYVEFEKAAGEAREPQKGKAPGL